MAVESGGYRFGRIQTSFKAFSLSLSPFVLERLERRPDAGRRWEVLFFVVVIATHLLAASVRCFVPRWIFFPL